MGWGIRLGGGGGGGFRGGVGHSVFGLQSLEWHLVELVWSWIGAL